MPQETQAPSQSLAARACALHPRPEGRGFSRLLVKRGEIWLVNLDPTIGSEIKKSRPCVVVSPPEMNDALHTVLVAPMTSKGFAAPFRIPILHAGTTGLVLLDQLRSVDKAQLVKRMGAAPVKTLTAVLNTLQEVFTE